MTGVLLAPGAAVLYRRRDCPLCFVLHRSAARAARRHNIPLIVIDIDSDADLLARYGSDIPVLILPGGAMICGRAETRQVEEAFLRARRSIPAGSEDARPAAGRWLGLRRFLEATGLRPRRAR